MGGSGSGEWFRWNARETVESCLCLDINKLVREGAVARTHPVRGSWHWTNTATGEVESSVSYLFEPQAFYGPVLRVNYKVTRGYERHKVDLLIQLQHTRPNFGGVRWWFTCPYCSRRVGKLYQPSRAIYFSCRKCHDLRYQSQRVAPVIRLINRAKKLRYRLGGDGTPHFKYTRPKGMHRRTYYRLLREVITLDAAIENAIESYSMSGYS